MNGKTMLGKRVRHLSRYREIAHILIRNGFGWFIDEIGLAHLLTLPKRLFTDVEKRETLSTYERIRVMIEQLGPTFIKMGQVASLRADLLPNELAEQLAKLQDEVPPLPFATVRTIVESELGARLEDFFEAFDEHPIGSASIGQVHKATLKSGDVVAVKVQRPEIRRNIEIDFEILADIVRLAEKHFEWVRHYEISEVVEEFRHTLINESDYTIEAKNADRVRNMFKNSQMVYVPQIYWDFTTTKVLVMEFVDGIKLSDYERLDEAGYDRKILAARASRAVFTQMLIHGFFHADPHPGNLAALPGNQILFMDFGMVGRLSPEMKDRLASLIIGLMRRNTDVIIRALYRMGVVPLDIDERKLRRDVDELREKYYDVALSQVSLGESVSDLFTVAYKHRIKIPADLSLVGKTLLTIEGVVENLDPTFRIMDVAEPFGKRLLQERLNPLKATRHALGSIFDFVEFIIDVPNQVKLLFQEIRSGKAKVQLEIPEIQNILNKFDRISNRLSFSVILLAFSIFMAGLMIASSLAKSNSAIWNVPITEVGLVIGGLMVILLVWSIIRSGRL